MELVGPPKTGFPQLYHYQPFNADWLHQIIVHKHLYFSNPARFNDPWDCRPHFDTDAAFDSAVRDRFAEYYIRITRNHAKVPEEVIQRQARRLRDDPDYLRKKIDEFSADFSSQIDRCWRVYCVSTHPDSELMWAHYASSHRGVCLEFVSRSPVFFQALRVAYLDNYPVFDMAEEDASEVLRVLLTKSSAWKYEDEYRLIALEKTCTAPTASAPGLVTDNNLLKLPDNSLKAVIVGCLADASTVDAARAIVRQASYPVALKRAVKIPNRYRLLVTDIT